MRASVESFRIGLAAFVVPYMVFFSDALLPQGSWVASIHVTAPALLGIDLLSSAIVGWFFGRVGALERALPIGAALAMLKAGVLADASGLAAAAGLWGLRRMRAGRWAGTS